MGRIEIVIWVPGNGGNLRDPIVIQHRRKGAGRENQAKFASLEGLVINIRAVTCSYCVDHILGKVIH